MLVRFWIELDADPAGWKRSFGVTAVDRGDALQLLRECVFRGKELPNTKSVVENVDVSTLDANHVLPNVGNVLVRGIWFPQGFTPESRLSF